MKYYFHILIGLVIMALFSFFFKLTKWYGNNKFIPQYQMNPQQQVTQNQCHISNNPLHHNPSYQS